MARIRDVLVVIILLNIVICEDIPGCDFFDTVDLTHHKPLENGSYIYEDVIIPHDQTGEYNYQILFGGKRRKVPQHTRGCVCQIKSCLRFCCDPQSELNESKRMCIHKYSNYSTLLLNMTQNNGEREVSVLEHFIVQKIEVPCKNGYFIKPEESAEDKWSLSENGMLYQHYNNLSFDRQSYCLQPQKTNYDEYMIVRYQCYPPVKKVKLIIQGVSIICLTLVIVLKIFIMHRHGNYYVSIRLQFYYAYLLLSFSVQIIKGILGNDLGYSMCLATGYFGYFVRITMYLYLFDLNRYIWISFKSYDFKHSSVVKSHVFAWIGASIMLLVTYSVDIFNNAEDEASPAFYLWKPGFALYTCWIKTHDWSAMVFYFGLMAITLLTNIILGNLTAWRYSVEMDIYRRIRKEQKTNYILLVNFYINMMLTAGIMRSFAIISYLTGYYWIDVVSSTEGIVLFIVIIIQNRSYMCKRFFKKASQQDNTDSTYMYNR